MSETPAMSRYSASGHIEKLGMTFVHYALGEVKVAAIFEEEFAYGADSVYTSKAKVVDEHGSQHLVPLWELWYQDKPLPVVILDYEQECERSENQPYDTEELYLHSNYGIVAVMKRYDGNTWLCRIQSSLDVDHSVKFHLDYDAFSKEQSCEFSKLKEFHCHPSELIPLSHLKHLNSRDGHLYAVYGDNAFDSLMEGLDEFVYVVTDLPRQTYTRRISTRYGVKKVTRKEYPKVLARGETTGKFYILPAFALWRITGEFEVDTFGEKIAERYRWQDPQKKELIPMELSQQFTYPLSSSYRSDIPEIADETIHEEKAEFTTRPESSREMVLQHVNRDAWYWKLPPVSAKELGLSLVNIHWSGKPLRAGNLVAIIDVKYKGRLYKIPVFLGSNRELNVKVRSRKVAAFLCRYTSIKHAELRLLKAGYLYRP